MRGELDETGAYMRRNLLVATDDLLAVRVGRGRHRLQVVALDRAGNRSRPAKRMVRS
jgi:hypothetical protein